MVFVIQICSTSLVVQKGALRLVSIQGHMGCPHKFFIGHICYLGSVVLCESGHLGQLLAKVGRLPADTLHPARRLHSQLLTSADLQRQAELVT